MTEVTDAVLALAASPWVHVVLFGLVLLDGLLPPLPSETVLVALASLAATTGAPNLVLLTGVAACAAALGDNLAYGVGRLVGVGRFGWQRRPRTVRAVARAATGLDRHAAALLLAARFVPVGRVAVNLTAGATRFPRRRFVPLTVVAGLAWSGYSVGVGVAAGAWVRDNPLLGAALAIVLVLVLGVLVDGVHALVRRRRAAAGRPPRRRGADVTRRPARRYRADGPGHADR